MKIKKTYFNSIFFQTFLSISIMPLNIAMANLCQPISDTSHQLIDYINNGSIQKLSTKRVPCQNSISLSTDKQCGAFGKKKKWIKFTLNKNDPQKSGSKRNELSIPKEQYVQNGSRVTYKIDTIIPKKGVYLLKDPQKKRNTAVVFFQVKGVNGFSPALAARIRNDGKLCVTKDNRILKKRPNGKTYYESVRTELYVGDMEDLWGKPLNFEFQVHFDPNEENRQGFINGNLNGRRIFSHRGPVGFHEGDPEVSGNGDEGYYAKFGIYNSNRNDVPEEIDLTICHSNFHVVEKNPNNSQKTNNYIKASYEETDSFQ